jgi:hypothetical protein
MVVSILIALSFSYLGACSVYIGCKVLQIVVLRIWDVYYGAGFFFPGRGRGGYNSISGNIFLFAQIQQQKRGKGSGLLYPDAGVKKYRIQDPNPQHWPVI